MDRKIIPPPVDPAMERIISRIMTCAPYLGCIHEKECFSLARHLRDWYRWSYTHELVLYEHQTPFLVQEMGVPVVWEEVEDPNDDYALYAH